MVSSIRYWVLTQHCNALTLTLTLTLTRAHVAGTVSSTGTPTNELVSVGDATPADRTSCTTEHLLATVFCLGEDQCNLSLLQAGDTREENTTRRLTFRGERCCQLLYW
jgi:hypothetical protein